MNFIYSLYLLYFYLHQSPCFSRLPQHHGAAGLRERKLTSTLFLVTLGSLLTILPTIIRISLFVFDFRFLQSLSRRSTLNFHLIVTDLLFLTNALINPAIYAIRMPDARAGILQIMFCRLVKPTDRVDRPVHNV